MVVMVVVELEWEATIGEMETIWLFYGTHVF